FPRVSESNMVENFLDVLTRHAPADDLQKLDPLARKLDALSQQLAAILGILDVSSRSDLLAQFDAEVRACLKEVEATGVRSGPLPPGDPQGDSATWSGNSTG